MKSINVLLKTCVMESVTFIDVFDHLVVSKKRKGHKNGDKMQIGYNRKYKGSLKLIPHRL